MEQFLDGDPADYSKRHLVEFLIFLKFSDNVKIRLGNTLNRDPRGKDVVIFDLALEMFLDIVVHIKIFRETSVCQNSSDRWDA